ncbi:type II toxin-antitoxin system VapB family antitoxin [Mesorhizobium qingshengii]|uniref:Type II toxin-antitoxin system VapB family antitoxin n=1 Tax=Mesorhizobium qingshengii TaxID=1165689 RepID=A0ABT4R3Q7_9HYPH|nr:type II toxin-antitoxin system VapB family antitoxin [Mesorhizobium qingshengii]MCZ8548462.1 type II toxin-antitoxin system VapB family antitoxin [Mesorhizobium qingshengii]
MAFSVKDDRTDAAVRRLAKLKNMSLTETIRDAVEQEYQRSRGAIPLAQRLQALAERYRAFPETGAQADKAFFDDLSGNS